MCVAALLLVAPCQSVYGQAASAAPVTNAASAAQNPGAPSFLTGKTRLWKGRSQIICFQLPQPATQDQTYSCQVDEKLVQVLVPPKILAGEKIGYMRVQALAEGKTQLDLQGAKLDLTIVTDPAFPAVSAFNLHIVSPADGANVWGEFSVGVEQMTLGDPAQLPIPVLHLSNGKEVAGHVLPDKKPTQYGRWVYDLKPDDLSPGVNHLVAVTTDVQGRPTESNAIELDEVSPDPATTLTGSCKDSNSVDHPPKTGGPGGIFKDAQYGDVVQGIWSLPLWITKEQEGRYQMVLTARGDLAGDGLPSFGMSIDEDGQSGTAVRLATTEWRRVPVGHPIVLTEGGHMLNVRLGNQFAQGPDDHRSLYLQKYELVRLDAPAGGPRLAANGGDMGDPTLPMTGSAPVSMMEMNKSRGRVTRELHMVFTDNLDGQMVAGTLDCGAKCWWPNQELHAPPPTSELYVNHKLVSSQNGAAPRFTVDPSAFVRGRNTLQLRALLPSGQEAKSVEFTVDVPQDFPLPDRPPGPSADATPPVVSLAYAPQDVGEGRDDAVVARVMDNRKVAAADLVIDDQPQHLDLTPLHGVGPLVFPLLTRDLKPGRHHFKVVAHDDAGNQASSPETPFTISAAGQPGLSRYQRAVFLLNRFGYGPESGELAEILTKGETAWLQSRMAIGITTPGEMNLQEMLRVEFGHPQREGDVTTDAIQYLLSAPNPVRAHFLMWTENHFSTWIRKEGLTSKGQEHNNFLQLGPAPFFDLLFTSSTSPGMLFYLDQINSFAHRLNENYAREIMELHTLGVKGDYTQTDVTTLAGLLTGWTLAAQPPDDGTPGGQGIRYFGYDPHLNDGKVCRIFGMEFPAADPAKRFDRVLMALEMLSAHPSCAQFISRKLCEEYVCDPAPPALVDALAQVYLETGGDMSAMMVAMSQHPDFWASPPKVANPIDFAIRDSRLAHSDNPQRVSQFLSQSGMGMFDRATPDGYPADDGYSVNTNALLQRWRFSQGIQNDFLHAGLIPTSLRPPDAAWSPDTTQRLLDLAAFRITGNSLSEASNDAAQKLLADSQGDTEARLHTLATFICQLPENSLK
jgi:hypothetical protein